jgi:cytochrome bd ubiquinol oxidase subunit II
VSLLQTAQELTWTLPHAVAGTMVLSLNAYVLLGGADFGGGVWDLLARGKHRDQQRALIAEAIGPIWEANHVWLILVVVLLFSCFPKAFAHLATELHVPITIMLVGIVLRGSAFTFRTYDSKQDAVQRRWGRIFSVASLLTPIVLGVCLGAVAGGDVPMRSAAEMATLGFRERFIAPWSASPFPWAVGVLTLMLFAFLAASYLTVEARDPALRRIFQRRAQQSQLALLFTAIVTLLLARAADPLLFDGLTKGTTALAMHGVTAFAAAVSLWALATERFQLARLAAAAQATFILWGWAWTQFPWLIPPDRTITELAAPRITLQLTLGALAVGTLILLPSFVYLFRIFKSGETAFESEAP